MVQHMAVGLAMRVEESDGITPDRAHLYQGNTRDARACFSQTPGKAGVRLITHNADLHVQHQATRATYPSATFHDTIVPSVIVGERAGIDTTVWSGYVLYVRCPIGATVVRLYKTGAAGRAMDGALLDTMVGKHTRPRCRKAWG